MRAGSTQANLWKDTAYSRHLSTSDSSVACPVNICVEEYLDFNERTKLALTRYVLHHFEDFLDDGSFISQ